MTDAASQPIGSRPGRHDPGRADVAGSRDHDTLIERRPGRLETLQAFGFAERVIAEAFHLTAMSFWASDPADPCGSFPLGGPSTTLTGSASSPT